MRIGFSSSCAIGLAIALTVGGVSTVQAQQTDSTRQTTRITKKKVKTTSTQRIPIKKESGGEVAPPVNQDSIAAAERARQDSIAAAAARARADSIARAEQMRRDSIAAAERRKQDSIAAVEKARQDSIARADSIAAAERARISFMRRHGGWYFGLGAGVSIPTGDITSNTAFNNGGYTTGWNITLPVGYDWGWSPLGVRLDGTFDQLQGRNFNSNFSAPNLDVWGLNLGVRLRVPLGRTWNRFYVIGGGSWADYSGFFTDFTDPNNPTNKGSASRWGWNAGAGFNFNWGKMVGLFLESRYVWLNAHNE